MARCCVESEYEIILRQHDCGKCGALKGDHCVTVSGANIGQQAVIAHHARWHAAIASGALPAVFDPELKMHVWNDVAKKLLAEAV